MRGLTCIGTQATMEKQNLTADKTKIEDGF